MSAHEFQRAAASFPDPFRLLVKESVPSTNDELLALGRNGAPSGLVLLALDQSAGRGRRGATWISPPGEALAFSLLVRPTEPQILWPRLALAAGLAVAEAVESFGIPAGIKWPNDVWIRHLKVAGILVEAGPDFAVVGIGLNVNSARLPEEVAEIATSLRVECGTVIPRSDVLAAVIRRFAIRQSQIGAEFTTLLQGVRDRCVLTGHRVKLTTAGSPRQGLVTGIAPGGELILKSGTCTEYLLQADEVRIIS